MTSHSSCMPVRERRVQKPKKNYINNRALFERMRDWKDGCRRAEREGRQKPPIPEYVGAAIKLLCERMSMKMNFVGYSYREELVGDAIVDCVHGAYTFDSDRFSNPFGYFSMIAWRAMIRKIYKEKLETYVKHKSFLNGMISGDNYESHPDWADPRAVRTSVDSSTSSSPIDGATTVSDGVVADFEALLDRRRKKKESSRTDDEVSLQTS